MAEIISGGNEAFTTLAFGLPNYQTVEYFDRQFANLDRNRYLSPTFVEEVYNTYEQYSGSNALERARAILRQNKVHYDVNQIYFMNNLEDMQLAELRMQRFLMANPTIRTLFHNQQCSGYVDTYVDRQPGVVGEEHLEYQMVRNNICYTFEGDDDEVAFATTTYFYELDEHDQDLSFDEQVDLINTWEIMDRLIAKGKDPTSLYGDELV